MTILAHGILFAVLTFAIKGPVGPCAGLLSGWMHSRPSVLLWLYRSSGILLLGLAVRLAFEGRE
jgi:threonine/homoserine/homoserine lactone efflux protein